jgi:hypothetical protein
MHRAVMLVESRRDVGRCLVLHLLWSHLGLPTILGWVRLGWWEVRAWLHLSHARMLRHVHGHLWLRLEMNWCLVRSRLWNRSRLEVLHLEMRR